MTADHRLGAVLTADATTGLCDVTVAGTVITAKALGFLPVAGQQVWVEQRGDLGQDWVITDLHDVPTVQKVTGHAMVSVNPGDITSGSAVDVGFAPTINVPVWAQDGTHSIFVKVTANPVIITAQGTFPFRVVDGGITADEGALSTTQLQGPASTQFAIVASGTFPLPAATATRTQIKCQAYRTAGTGAIRYNSTAGNASTTALFEWEIT